MSPKVSIQKIIEYLDRYIVGQSEAKLEVASAIMVHVLNTIKCRSDMSFKPKKTNLLLMGPSGCGKTYILEKAAQFVGLPLLIINCKSLTNTGYVGTSIEDYLSSFADELVSTEKRMLPYTIVVLDEFDKMCLAMTDTGWTDSLQYSLLKIIEGCEICTRRSRPMNTHTMLFLLAGSFEKMIKKRHEVKLNIGFSEDDREVENIGSLHSELINYGIVKELAGRIGAVAEIQQLSEEELTAILLHSENSIYSQYKDILKAVGYYWQLNDQEIKEVVGRALSHNIGARGLNCEVHNKAKHILKRVEVSLDDMEKGYISKSALNSDGFMLFYSQDPEKEMLVDDLHIDDDDPEDGYNGN